MSTECKSTLATRPITKLFVSLALLFSVSTLRTSALTTTEDNSTFGTLIGALGNKNGMVVFTDSRGSYTDARGVLHARPGDFQKLLRFDDSTVCSIAGLGTAKVHVAPELDADLLGVIQSYSEESRKYPRQSMQFNLTRLSHVLALYLDGIAEINAVTGYEADVGMYHLQVLLAGYDIDGTPKVGELVLQVVRQTQPNSKATWATSVRLLNLVKIEGSFTWVLGGMNDAATDALTEPQKSGGYEILEKYHRARMDEKDRGSSLSTDDMDQLARALVSLTSEKHKEEVGGAKQIAILNSGHISRISQPNFLPLHRPFPFTIIRDSYFEYPPLGQLPPIVIVGDPVKFYDSTTLVGATTDPSLRPQISLDRTIFVHCILKNVVLWYDGGPVYFDSTNEVLDSELDFGSHAFDHPDMARHLKEQFDLASKKSTSH